MPENRQYPTMTVEEDGEKAVCLQMTKDRH